jgi:hypothetical protein
MIHYDLLQSDINNFMHNSNKFCGFKHVVTDNDKLIIPNKTKNFFIVTRSIAYSNNITKYIPCHDEIPIIGFQGFGKNLDKIANQIQKEFDKAIFRLHMPFSYYGDPDGHHSRGRIREIQNIITKPGIKIEVSHDFLSDEELVQWLNKNTINCYFYDYLENSGISSSPDYAIAAMRPIAVNNSRMLVNLHNLKPSIEIEHNSLKQIIKNGITPLIPIHEKYKNQNLIRDYENMCDVLLKKI